MHAGTFDYSEKEGGWYTGTVEHVFFTQGGCGNQYTIIDEEKFVSYYDARTSTWKIGDEVSFFVDRRPHGFANLSPRPDTPHASKITCNEVATIRAYDFEVLPIHQFERRHAELMPRISDFEGRWVLFDALRDTKPEDAWILRGGLKEIVEETREHFDI